jgi:hypothetical protein
VSIKEIWQGERFNWYRKLHLEGRGAEAFPCRGCSAWLAGIRDWNYGWLKVLKTSGEHVKDVMKKDLGVEVEILPARRERTIAAALQSHQRRGPTACVEAARAIAEAESSTSPAQSGAGR